MDARTLCGRLIVGGFPGAELPASFAKSLRTGERAGAVLFRRNLGEDLADVASLCAEIARASSEFGESSAPIVAVDQEGGRVARLTRSVLQLPAARAFGKLGDPSLVRQAARALGTELLALGFTLDFAPVLDVDTREANPIIGDRSFSSDPRVVGRMALAFAEGLGQAGILSCGKHFPGHGDTELDSHLDLPRVYASKERLHSVELPPFRDAIGATISSLMTAHVVYEALDPSAPATLSPAIATALLRGTLGFQGVLFSDDLEMKAIADRMSIEDAAVLALRAGCDALLICSSEDLQSRALDALVAEAEKSAAFRERCTQAGERVSIMRRGARHAPFLHRDDLARVFERAEHRELTARLGELP